MGTGANKNLGVIVVDHGSRRPESHDALLEVVAALARAEGFSVVEPAHMDLAEPGLETAFARCVDRGAKQIVVIPFFLLPGRHLEEDIPSLVRAAAKAFPGIPYLVTAPLGSHPLMSTLLAARIRGCLEGARNPENGCGECRSGNRKQCRFTQMSEDGGEE